MQREAAGKNRFTGWHMILFGIWGRHRYGYEFESNVRSRAKDFQMRRIGWMFLYTCWSGATLAGLICREAVFDFGEREEGDVVEHSFVLENPGDKAVVIERVRTSCGCTAATPSAKVVGAGKSIELRAALNLKKRSGPQRKTVHVYCRDEEKRLELVLQGQSLARMEMKPKFLFFGKIQPGIHVEKSLTIRALREELNPGKPQCSLDQVSCRLTKQQDGSYTLTAGLENPEAVGDLRGTVKLPIYGGRETLSIPIYATVPKPIKVVPSSLFFPKQIKDKPLRRRITLRSESKAPFSVLKVDCPDPSADVVIQSQKEGVAIILFSNLTPAALDGQDVVITTDAKDMPSITVPCTIK